MTDFSPCAIVPTYDNPATVRAVVEGIRRHLPDVIVVDDGSGEPGRSVVEALGREGLAKVMRLERNEGKGAAVMAGLRRARELGFTHAVLLDADLQHEAGDIPRFLEAAREDPAALIAGVPVFDETAPALRRNGRRITCFWTNLETGGKVIHDPLCGFRVYPVESALRARVGSRMEFDPEIAVRMAWLGTAVVNLPTRVRYLRPDEGGVSHFRMFRDNVRISWMHTRLATLALLRWLAGRWRKLVA